MLYSKDLTVSMCHFSLTFLIHIGCICLTFLHCAFSKFSSNCLTEKIHSHIDCICLTFLRCAFEMSPEKMQSDIGHIYSTFLHCAFSNVSSNCLSEMMQNHIGCICLTFSTVSFQMCPQMACLRRCIVTLVALV